MRRKAGRLKGWKAEGLVRHTFPTLLTRDLFANRFGRRAVIGMVHLAPLPGAPLYGGSLDEVIARALADAEALAAGGVTAIAVENFGDRPFRKNRVEPETIAA